MKEYLTINSNFSSVQINDIFEYKESFAEQTTKKLNNQKY